MKFIKMIVTALIPVMMLCVVSCGKKDSSSDQFRFNANDFLENPPLDYQTAVSYVRSITNRSIAASVSNPSDNGTIISKDKDHLSFSTYTYSDPNCLNSLEYRPAYCNTGTHPTSSIYYNNSNYRNQNNPQCFNNFSGHRSAHCGNNNILDLVNRINNSGNFATTQEHYQYTGYSRRSGVTPGFYGADIQQLGTYNLQNHHPGPTNSTHDFLRNLVRSAQMNGQYEFRYDVHYIVSNGIVYGISFRVPLHANPVAIRHMQSDSGYYIKTH